MDLSYLSQQQQQCHHHFLIVAHPVQGQVAPALSLTRRLISTAGCHHVTFSTSTSATLRLSAPSSPLSSSANLTLVPYPYAYSARTFKPESASDPRISDAASYPAFSSIILDIAARGRPVTCVIPTLLVTWAVDMPGPTGSPRPITGSSPPPPSPATTSYFFHGSEPFICPHRNGPLFPMKLPGLPPMQIRDLPSFITDDATSDGRYSMILPRFKESFEQLDVHEPKPKILVNTFAELEPEALASVDEHELIPIGPIFSMDGNASELGLFEQDEKKLYTTLSGSTRDRINVAFGSISVMRKVQMEEIIKGLKASGRPYLWVVRRDGVMEGAELDRGDGGIAEEEKGMVVEWCSQMEVLSHPAVGCFVTHCGWNSMTESEMCGLPMVGAPQWADQRTNLMLAERAWGIGVRGEWRG